MFASLAALAGVELRDVARRNMMAAGFYLAAAVTGLGASGYALAALSLYLVPIYGEIVSHLIIAAGLLSLMIVAIVSALVVKRRPARENKAAAAMIGAPIALELTKTLAPRLGKALPLVLLAGIVAGRAMTQRN
jgi:hypothetical protein